MLIINANDEALSYLWPDKNWLLARYKLDGNLNDSHNSNNLTQYSSPTYTTWLKGQAIATGGGYANLSIGNTFTIRFYVKGNTTEEQAGISIFTSTSFQYYGRLDILRYQNGGTHVKQRNSGGSTYSGVTYPSNLYNGVRHHVVVTRNGTACQLFVDWVKYTGNLQSVYPTYLGIKAKDWLSSNINIDEVLVYNRIWSDSEVAKDYSDFQKLI